MTRSFCHYGSIPSDMMDIIEEDLNKNFDHLMQVSRLMGNKEILERRNSKNAWVPTTYWLGGLMWHYFKKVNDEFFNYNLDCIDGESMQYTHYGLNQKYDWHQDEGINSLYKPQSSGNRNDNMILQDFMNNEVKKNRKLTCILQLANEEDYEGGDTQVRDIDNTMITLSKKRGTLFFFDSRLQHRAMKVKKGLRKSLIIWAVGPRWK